MQELVRATPEIIYGDLPPFLDLSEAALFLDVDGTLVEIAETPDAVLVDTPLITLLRRLSSRGAGAVALISGRTIANLDALFEPLLLPVAGMHGLERRNAFGVYERSPMPSQAALSQLRQSMFEISARHPGLLLEDKECSFALHYRRVPHLELDLACAMFDLLGNLDMAVDMVTGRMMFEVRPRGATKVDALEQFMNEPPFSGRRPIFVGDDLTDESAFKWVNECGGLSVAVDMDRETAARIHLSSVEAARNWLQRLTCSMH